MENNAIRLTKGKDSKVPNKLLFDLVSQINAPVTIMNGTTADASGTGSGGRYGKRTLMSGAGGPLSPAGMHPVAQAPQDRIGDSSNGISSATDGVGNMQLSNQGGATREKKKSKKKEKIKIFQRAGGQKGSTGNLRLNANGGDANSSNRRKKNLSDKEKAYAEARARIFSSSSENNGTKNSAVVQPNNMDESTSDQRNSNCTPITATVTTSSAQDMNTACNNTGGRKFSPDPVVSAEFRTGRLLNSSPLSETQPPTLSFSTIPVTTTTVVTAESPSFHFAASNDTPMEPTKVIGTNTPPTNSRANNNAPAAVTSGAMSKVTWRNRQQEASDPDFQRGVHVVGGLGVPMTAAPPPVSYHYHGNQYHPPPSAHQCGVMPGVGAGMGHNLMNGYHSNAGGIGAGAVPVNSGIGGGMLELGGYHPNESPASWQRQDINGGCGVTATAMHQSQQIPPVIFSNSTPATHHGQYQVLLQQQHQYSSSIGLQLGANGGGTGNAAIGSNHQRHGNAPLHRDSQVDSSGSRLVYTAEDFPALG